MAFDALAIANYFLDKAKGEGKSLTPLALQKLVYFAHGWHLAIRNHPLINQRVEAWEYGPVIADIYHQFKEFGKSSITRKATRGIDYGEAGYTSLDPTECVEPEFPKHSDSEQSRTLLDRVWDVYKNFSGVQLSNLTHIEGSPWSKTRDANPGARGCIIDDALIKEFFRAQAAKNAAKRAQS